LEGCEVTEVEFSRVETCYTILPHSYHTIASSLQSIPARKTIRFEVLLLVKSPFASHIRIFIGFIYSITTMRIVLIVNIECKSKAKVVIVMTVEIHLDGWIPLWVLYKFLSSCRFMCQSFSYATKSSMVSVSPEISSPFYSVAVWQYTLPHNTRTLMYMHTLLVTSLPYLCWILNIFKSGVSKDRFYTCASFLKWVFC